MDLRISPEPTEAERAAIEAALEEGDREPAVYASAWRKAALDPGDDYAEAPPRSNRGATRA